MIIRPISRDDIPRLTDIDPSFTANTTLKVTRLESNPFGGWQLEEENLPVPFDKGQAYDFDGVERKSIKKRFESGKALQEVLEENGTLRGILDVEEEEWRYTAWVWNLMLDRSVRGQGYGRTLMQHTISWARERGLRAILLETQTNNTPACRFYARLGFELIGINEIFYTNSDLERGEVALFWGYKL